MEMPKNFGVALPMTLMGGEVLKLVYTVTVTCDGTTNKNYIVTCLHPVNNLVQIRFKWDFNNKIVKNYKIGCSFSARRYKLNEMHTTVEMDIHSDKMCYSEKGFCPTECWSQWQSISKITASLVSSTTNMYYISCDFYITANKIKTETMSKLYTDTDFTDFRLGCTEGSVKVHKACLAAHSDVFKRMLSGEWQETAEGKITMEGVNLETLQNLKDYMYLGAVLNEGLRPLLLLAKCYLIEELEKQCIIKLAKAVTPSDLYSLHKFACENNIPELTFATLQLTRDSVVSSASFCKKYKLNS